MPRVKRSVHARKKRRKVLEQAKGYWGLKSTQLPLREGAGRALARLRLPRPQEQEARRSGGSGSCASTPARARTGSRTTSSSRACKAARSSSTARCSPTSPSSDPAAFGKIAEQAKSALAELRRRRGLITSRDNEKLKLVRKLHERRWRDKLGLFVCEGEDLVDGARRARAGRAARRGRERRAARCSPRSRRSRTRRA